MEYRRLGANGPLVSLVGLGCNNFGGRADFDATRKVVHRALDLGITLFDTADSYGYHSASEEYLGKILGSRRKDIVLATKFGNIIKGSGLTERPRISRGYILSAVENSLRRLQSDTIDLLEIHYPDSRVPLEEILGTLNGLIEQGKVRYIGCCNFSASELEAAQMVARQNNLAPLVSGQRGFSLLEREVEHALLPAVEKQGMGFLPSTPLARGLLSGKYRAGGPLPTGARLTGADTDNVKYLNDANLRSVYALSTFAEARGHSLLTLAFGWLAAHPAVSSVIAGAMSPSQVEQNAAAVAWIPSATEMAEIKAILDQS